MLEINFKLEGVTEMSRRFRTLDDKIKDFKPEFKESVDFLKGFFEGEVFETKGRAIGEPWKARKQPTGQWPLLERSGTMRRSFRDKAEALRGEVWNAASYFKYHQSRMPRSSNLPRRVMMKLIDQLKNQIIQIFHKGVYNRIKESR